MSYAHSLILPSLSGTLYVYYFLEMLSLEVSGFWLVAVVEKAHLSLQLPLAAELPHPSLRYAVLAGESRTGRRTLSGFWR